MANGVIPCLTGNMVYALIKLGYINDVRLQDAISWIVKYQRADDAERDGPVGSMYDRYEVCYGRHSCHMGVAKTLKALAAIPLENRSSETTAKTDELVEYFLKHHIFKKSHDLDTIARPGWLKLGFPLMYQTDILELAGIMHDLEIKDSRMKETMEIIKGKQLQDGKWKLENSNNGKLLVDIEKKGQPSKWITLKALSVLCE